MVVMVELKGKEKVIKEYRIGVGRLSQFCERLVKKYFDLRRGKGNYEGKETWCSKDIVVRAFIDNDK